MSFSIIVMIKISVFLITFRQVHKASFYTVLNCFYYFLHNKFSSHCLMVVNINFLQPLYVFKRHTLCLYDTKNGATISNNSASPFVGSR